MTKFRVHYETGETIDLDAKDPDDARQKATKQHAGIVSKVKVLKGQSA